MTELQWSLQQELAIKKAKVWIKGKSVPQVFRLFGYAGTGKSTLATHLAADVKGNVCFGAFTGKAASVMRKKGCKNASTIHSMIYTAVQDEFGKTRFEINRNGPAATAKLIVIDECSMVGEELANDLMSFGKPILVLGDPAQLPPVKGTGVFTNATPDSMLTEIHRQALENPIVRLSMDIREGRRIQYGDHGAVKVIERSALTAKRVLSADMSLVGLNKTREINNIKIRGYKGIESETPIVGEKLICLKNNREKKMLNGTIWTVLKVSSVDHEWVRLVVCSEDDESIINDVEIHMSFFVSDVKADEELIRWSDQMTFGYAVTTHKSQGSQWSDIVVFDESRAFREDADRWLYTAITRAADTVTIVR